MEEYYYSQMDKLQKNAYHAIKTGLAALETTFMVPRLEGRELTDVFFKVRLDHPEIFYAVGFHYRFYPDSNYFELIPEYLFDNGKIKEHQKAMKARVEKLVRPAKQLSEWEKERYIHDFVCSNVRYDKLKKPYSHEIIGPLGHGVGVCEGIAKTVKMLCDAMGIWCIIAISEANPDKQIKYRHAWNVIRIDGRLYQLDVTFDNSLSHGEIIRYDYFNLEDKQFFRDHEPVIYAVPLCAEGNHFYYMEKKLSFTKLEDLKKRATQAMKKKQMLIFHWRGGHLTKPVVSEILTVLSAAAGEKSMHARTGLNWAQGIFQIQFTEEVPMEECVVEEANEGER